MQSSSAVGTEYCESKAPSVCSSYPGSFLLAVIAVISILSAGCIQTIDLRIYNGFDVPIIVQQVLSEADPNIHPKVFGIVAAKGTQTFEGQLRRSTLYYHIQFITSDGKLMKDLLEPDAEVEKNMENATWVLSIGMTASKTKVGSR